MKILIVDDEADIRTIARMSLERIGGMSVLEAASGPEAVEIAAREAPEAILLDVMMPVMDGTATLAALRANDKTTAIPVVYLTAKALPGEVERLKALGARGVLTKPFEPMTLAQQVRDALASTSTGLDRESMSTEDGGPRSVEASWDGSHPRRHDMLAANADGRPAPRGSATPILRHTGN